MVKDKSVKDKNVKDKNVKDKNVEDKNVEDKSVEDKSGEDKSGEGYAEIKMGGGWYITISLAHSERFDKEYVEIAKERGGNKKSRFNLNPAHVRALGETLIKFADENKI
ncbi:MAG: hypothetical protein PHV51_04870 [Methanosarcinaceae archaeon]|nr:hypothetical protein [Methanosarcinaceae archaeon]